MDDQSATTSERLPSASSAGRSICFNTSVTRLPYCGTISPPCVIAARTSSGSFAHLRGKLWTCNPKLEARPVAEPPAKTKAPRTRPSSRSARLAARWNFATDEAQRSSAHCMTSATSGGTSSGFSPARIKRLPRTDLSIEYLASPSLKTVISFSACGPTRSSTHWRILGLRTLVIAPPVTSRTICWISSNSVVA